SNVREDFILTDIQRQTGLDVERVQRGFAALESQAGEVLERQGFGAGARQILRSADLRYRGMRTELTVDAEGEAADEASIGALLVAFHRAHHAAYGYSYEGLQEVELVNLRVSGIGLLPAIPAPRADMSVAAGGPAGSRQVYFDGSGFVDTPV